MHQQWNVGAHGSILDFRSWILDLIAGTGGAQLSLLSQPCFTIHSILYRRLPERDTAGFIYL
jgi:hypothetical protein